MDSLRLFIQSYSGLMILPSSSKYGLLVFQGGVSSPCSRYHSPRRPGRFFVDTLIIDQVLMMYIRATLRGRVSALVDEIVWLWDPLFPVAEPVPELDM
jgi:hypothetical protein